MGRSVSHTDLLSEYETPHILGGSFRRKVVGYIERCHLEDGGYCFFRMPPSSGMDTYFAVKSLATLGAKPKHPEAVVNFFLNMMKENSLGDLIGIFLTVEVMNELGQITDVLKNYVQRVTAFQNKAGGFGALENIYIEVPSELEATYRAARSLRIIGIDFDEQRVADFVFSLANPDGGYGKEGRSTLASTYYATEINRLLGFEIDKFKSTKDYLRNKETDWRENFDRGMVDYIENLFSLIKGLANLDEKSNFPDRVARFVMACQRVNGGFARATIMGIPNLEYTSYALSILREVGALKRFS